MDLTKKNVLIVDESLLMRKTLVKYLEPWFNCMEAHSPMEASIRMEDHQFDLIISEISFYGKPEDAFIYKIRSTQPGAKLILSVSSATEKLVRFALAYGISSIVVKPVHNRSLLQKIEQALGMEIFGDRALGETLPSLKFETEKRDSYMILSAIGRLVSNTCSTLKIKVESLLRQGVRRLALNLDRVTEIDFAGMQFIVKTCEAIRKLTGEFCLVNALSLLETLSDHPLLMSIVTIFLNEDDFMNSLKPTGSMVFPHLNGR